MSPTSYLSAPPRANSDVEGNLDALPSPVNDFVPTNFAGEASRSGGAPKALDNLANGVQDGQTGRGQPVAALVTAKHEDAANSKASCYLGVVIRIADHQHSTGLQTRFFEPEPAHLDLAAGVVIV